MKIKLQNPSYSRFFVTIPFHIVKKLKLYKSVILDVNEKDGKIIIQKLDKDSN